MLGQRLLVRSSEKILNISRLLSTIFFGSVCPYYYYYPHYGVYSMSSHPSSNGTFLYSPVMLTHRKCLPLYFKKEHGK